MKIATTQLAELIAFKGRTVDADEVTLLGFERAAVEIAFIAHSEAASLLRAKGHDAAAQLVEEMSEAAHRLGAERTRTRLHAELARAPGRELTSQWPPPGTPIAAALRRRQR